MLNLCRICGIYVNELYPQFQCEYLNVLPFPDYEPADYIKSVSQLVEHGHLAICISPDQQLDKREALEKLRSLNVEFLRSATVHLTNTGGRLWELHAQPRWSTYCLIEDRFEQESALSRGVLASQSLDVIVAYLGWYKQILNSELLPTTVSITRHVTYKVLYWKDLPDVYKAHFDSRSVKSESTPEDYTVKKWLDAWRQTQFGWYIKPWNHPDWPKRGRIT